MTISVELPDMAAVPVWAWWTVGITAWYFVAGLVIRRIDFHEDRNDPVENISKFMLWLTSPVVGPVAAAFFVAYLIGKTVLTPPKTKR